MYCLKKNFFEVKDIDLTPYLPEKITIRYKQEVVEYATNRKQELVNTKDFLQNYSELSEKYAGNNPIHPSIFFKLNFTDNLTTDINKVWIGAKGTFTHCHTDNYDNNIFQIKGKKKWTIFDSTDIKNLYFNIKYSSANKEEVSEVDFRNFKEEDYPLLKNANKIEIICEAGDYLFLPKHWPHFVENIEDSIMINKWKIK